MLGGIDFASIQLNYVSTFSNSSIQTFGYVAKAKKAQEGDKIIDIRNATELSLNSFLIGLTIPNYKFWVNLNPWESDRIIEKDLKETDVGKIMLDADFNMKKDFSNYENPCESKTGEDYQELLGKKQEDLVNDCMKKYPGQIKDNKNVSFSAATRHWIVPDKIYAYGNENEIYIVNATMNIKSEPVYNHSSFKIANQNDSSISKKCLECLNESVKEYGRYALELEETMVLPLVVQKVNSDNNYTDLRQVYVSLALAQWYKKHSDNKKIFSGFIDSGNLTGLESQTSWSAVSIWEKYVKSYSEGEYHCWKNKTYRTDRGTLYESNLYSGGGVDFEDIEKHIVVVDGLTPKMKEIASEAVRAPFAKDENDYYFGDIWVIHPEYSKIAEESPNGLHGEIKEEVSSGGVGAGQGNGKGGRHEEKLEGHGHSENNNSEGENNSIERDNTKPSGVLIVLVLIIGGFIIFILYRYLIS